MRKSVQSSMSYASRRGRATALHCSPASLSCGCVTLSVPSRRGAVLIETVLALPLILVLVSIIIFFGFQFMRLQRAAVATRYEAWRAVNDAPGPRWSPDEDRDGLDPLYFGGAAQSLGVVIDDEFSDEPAAILFDAAADRGTDARDLADAWTRELPGGTRARLVVRHDDRVPFWDRMTGPIRRRHTRLAGEWTYSRHLRPDPTLDKWVFAPGPVLGNDTLDAIRQAFLRELDEPLSAMASSNGLASTTRELYRRPPRYDGPDLPPAWSGGEAVTP